MSQTWKSISEMPNIQLALYEATSDDSQGWNLTKGTTALPLRYLDAVQELWIIFPEPVNIIKTQLTQEGTGTYYTHDVFHNGATTSLQGTGCILYTYDQSSDITYNNLPETKHLSFSGRDKHLYTDNSRPSFYKTKSSYFLEANQTQGTIITAGENISALLLLAWDLSGHQDNDITIDDIEICVNDNPDIQSPIITNVTSL